MSIGVRGVVLCDHDRCIALTARGRVRVESRHKHVTIHQDTKHTSIGATRHNVIFGKTECDAVRLVRREIVVQRIGKGGATAMGFERIGLTVPRFWNPFDTSGKPGHPNARAANHG